MTNDQLAEYSWYSSLSAAAQDSDTAAVERRDVVARGAVMLEVAAMCVAWRVVAPRPCAWSGLGVSGLDVRRHVVMVSAGRLDVRGL